MYNEVLYMYKDLLNLLELNYYFESKITIDINLVHLKIHYFYSNIWGCEILDIPKLRTYNSFKTSFGRENYVAMDMCKYLRSILAQFRCGILPLRIETGRYHGEPVEDRLCKLCSNNCRRRNSLFIALFLIYWFSNKNVW